MSGANEDFLWRIGPQVEALAQERFSQLVAVNKLAYVGTRRNAQETRFRYLLTQELGVEVLLEFMDESIFVYLVRLRNGRFPRTNDAVDDNRKLLRRSLVYLFRQVVQVQDAWLDGVLHGLERWSPPQRRGYQYADEILTATRDILERYHDFIMQLPEETLFPQGRRPK